MLVLLKVKLLLLQLCCITMLANASSKGTLSNEAQVLLGFLALKNTLPILYLVKNYMAIFAIFESCGLLASLLFQLFSFLVYYALLGPEFGLLENLLSLVMIDPLLEHKPLH
jgi:hypothetical protein